MRIRPQRCDLGDGGHLERNALFSQMSGRVNPEPANCFAVVACALCASHRSNTCFFGFRESPSGFHRRRSQESNFPRGRDASHR